MGYRFIGLLINARHPQRTTQLSVRFLKVPGYDHPELTKAYVINGRGLNGLFGKLAAFAIRIENHTVDSGFTFDAGQRTIIAVVNYFNRLVGQPITYFWQVLCALACTE